MSCNRASLALGLATGVPLGLVIAHELRRRLVVPRAERILKKDGWLLSLPAGELSGLDAYQRYEEAARAQGRIAVSRYLGRYCPFTPKHNDPAAKK